MAGAGYFSYQRIKGQTGIFDPAKFFGNVTTTVGSTKVYAQKFEEFEALGILDLKVNEKTSLRFAGDYVNNMGADSLNTGYLVSGSVNCGKDKGAVKLAVNYRKLESDAVIGAFTYSDFIGGGTDGKGFELFGSYGLGAGTSFDVTYLINKKGIADGEKELDYRRLMVDVQTKF
jgi:hypothetical protein